MKSFKVIAVLLFSLTISFYSCNDTTKTSKQDNSKSVEVSDTTVPSNASTQTPATTEPAQNAKGVWHYTCTMGCAGGAGSAVKCENCGVNLAHNTAYHSNSNTTSTANSSAPFATPAPAAAKKVEPSQNAAGVWHYTCAKGCTGGAGATGPCATCGDTLAHNKAYH